MYFKWIPHRLAVWLAAAAILTSWPLTAAARDLLDHARNLADQGDLSQAQGEIERFLYFNPESPRADEARRWAAEFDAAQANPATPPKPARPLGLAARSAAAMVRFYQNNLRTFTEPGGSCPSYPSCSEYSLQALEKHGLWLGIFIAVDRSWREMTTAGQPPKIKDHGLVKHYDPLEWNDHWLSGRQGSP
jgi:hypothetical protein